MDSAVCSKDEVRLDVAEEETLAPRECLPRCVCVAAAGNPEVIVLDEPFANLDPTTQIRLKAIIKDLAAKEGVAVLVSSHDLMHVTEVCERIVVLHKGEVVRDIKTSAQTLKELETFFASGHLAPTEIGMDKTRGRAN